MKRIETDDGDIISQLAQVRSSGTLPGNGDGPVISGFEAVFKDACRSPRVIRLLLQREFEFEAEIDASDLAGDEAGVLAEAWPAATFVVPNYSSMVAWSAKFAAEADAGKTVVAVIPARTNTSWFHANVLSRASELRFIRGRMTFAGHSKQSPFPDAIAVYRGVRADSGEATGARATSDVRRGRRDLQIAAVPAGDTVGIHASTTDQQGAKHGHFFRAVSRRARRQSQKDDDTS